VSLCLDLHQSPLKHLDRILRIVDELVREDGAPDKVGIFFTAPLAKHLVLLFYCREGQLLQVHVDEGEDIQSEELIELVNGFIFSVHHQNVRLILLGVLKDKHIRADLSSRVLVGSQGLQGVDDPVPIEGEQLEGDCVPLLIVLHMPSQHNSHLKVFLMRWNGEKHLRVVVQTEVIIVYLGGVVGFILELAVDALGVGIDLGVPADGNRIKHLTDVLRPHHIKHSSIHCHCLLFSEWIWKPFS